MHCDQYPGLLGPYLDGELAPDNAIRIQQHIAECPQCAAEIAERVQLKRSLRAARGHFAPSNDFRQKIQRQMAPPKGFRWRLSLVPAMAAIAALLIVSIGYLGWINHSRRADSFAEVADLHVGALSSTNPVDVISTDRHTVKPWFEGRIPFSFNLPDLSGTGFTLLGGRLVYLHQQPGAQLIFTIGQHKTSVMIFQNTSELEHALSGGATLSRRNTFSVETWEARGLRFLVIGDADPHEIQKLAQTIKSANL